MLSYSLYLAALALLIKRVSALTNYLGVNGTSFLLFSSSEELRLLSQLLSGICGAATPEDASQGQAFNYTQVWDFSRGATPGGAQPIWRLSRAEGQPAQTSFERCSELAAESEYKTMVASGGTYVAIGCIAFAVCMAAIIGCRVAQKRCMQRKNNAANNSSMLLPESPRQSQELSETEAGLSRLQEQLRR